MSRGKKTQDFREKYLRNLKVLSDSFNSAHAQALLGYAYEKGLFGLDASEDSTINYYTKSAAGGYAFGRGVLGQKLLVEDGLYESCEELIKEALPHLKTSAAAGNIQHALFVAEFLYKGIGFERDLFLAQSYHNRMAELMSKIGIREWGED